MALVDREAVSAAEMSLVSSRALSQETMSEAVDSSRRAGMGGGDSSVLSAHI